MVLRVKSYQICRRPSILSFLGALLSYAAEILALLVPRKPVLWIHDIWCGSGSWSVDPYLWLTDPDQTPDPTPFFATLRMQKKIFFLITYPLAHYLHSLIYCLKDNFCVKILFCKHYFSPLNTFMRKGKDPHPDPYLWPTDSDQGDPKTSRSVSPNTVGNWEEVYTWFRLGTLCSK